MPPPAHIFNQIIFKSQKAKTRNSGGTHHDWRAVSAKVSSDLARFAGNFGAAGHRQNLAIDLISFLSSHFFRFRGELSERKLEIQRKYLQNIAELDGTNPLTRSDE
jgi:hypothetical protein